MSSRTLANVLIRIMGLQTILFALFPLFDLFTGGGGRINSIGFQLIVGVLLMLSSSVIARMLFGTKSDL